MKLRKRLKRSLTGEPPLDEQMNLKQRQAQQMVEQCRPSMALTESIIRRFAKLASKGYPAGVIVDYLGISRIAFHRWIKLGETYHMDEKADPDHAIYGRFLLEYRRACAKYLRDRQRVLHQPDNKLFYREIVILERRDKKNWAKNEPTQNEADLLQPDERFL